jgi:hypothetical protein
MAIRENSIIFLLGAGASVDAGIMHAKAMTEDIERKIKSEKEFMKFEDLYNYLKSSIIYQRGLEGNFKDRDVNVEELLNVLSEIKLKDKNKLYPFIGSWNVHLQKVAGEDFEKATELDELIRKQLFKWINIRDYDKSDYFSGLSLLAHEIGAPIRVFTLNYDLCVEKALSKINVPLELGFNDTKTWEASKFDSSPLTEPQIYLYKLHGSIDWVRDDTQEHVLRKCDSPQDNPELIFGTTAKLSSIDPYLFYVHEFRKYSLQEPLRFIVTIGYSFSDDYVNRLISQSIKRSEYVKLLTVFPTFCVNEEEAGAKSVLERNRIATLLKVHVDKIVLSDSLAKDFFKKNANLEYFERNSEPGDDSPF